MPVSCLRRAALRVVGGKDLEEWVGRGRLAGRGKSGWAGKSLEFVGVVRDKWEEFRECSVIWVESRPGGLSLK